jgi:tRNA pseudouridine55 synthase
MGSRRDSLHGLIVVDKPAGLSSAAVVHRVRGRLGVRRAGHTGTLDPLATGVLPVCIGEATKLAGYLIAEDKAYRATIELGAETDTFDVEGEVVARDLDAAARVTRAAIDAAIARRTGPQQQEPPLYSAIKIGGRRMHEMARAGETVERAPRAVTIHSIAVVAAPLPRIVVDVACTKGTYIRSLAHDLGRDLGCGAHLVALRRTRTGPYGEDRAIPLDHLDRHRATTALIPMAQVTGMPSLVVDPALEPLVALGVVLSAGALGAAPPEASIFQLVSQDGRLLAVVGIERDQVRYHRVFRRLDDRGRFLHSSPTKPLT